MGTLVAHCLVLRCDFFQTVRMKSGVSRFSNVSYGDIGTVNVWASVSLFCRVFVVLL